ncbi:hypothetical protein ACT8ZR_08825 [Neobacillus sp. M.A.Huq-85]|nr:hypothetical protein QNK12_11425 [Neobacillus cucumis]
MIIYQIYDRHFNINEYFILFMILGGFSLIYFIPKIMPMSAMLFCLLFGPFLGMVFDHSLAVPPLDFYDVGDLSDYEFFDILSYMMYCPFGYLFIYFFKKFKVRGLMCIVYILVWTVGAIALEWLCVKIGIFHYKNGYGLRYSICIYVFVESLLVIVYHYFFRKRVYH